VLILLVLLPAWLLPTIACQDLQRLPLNGWSLTGLRQTAQAAGDASRAAALEEQRKQAWADAEVQIPSSCPALSQPGSRG
jgi:hypothetical protein